MARQTFSEFVNHCVVCGTTIPTDRVKRGAVTCSKEHAKLRKAQQMALVDSKECRYCRRPSTPLQREAFKRFRRLEQKKPELLYPEQFAEWLEATGGQQGKMSQFLAWMAKGGE